MPTTDNFVQPDFPPLVLPPTIAEPVAERKAAPTETIRVLHVVNGEHYAGAERVQDLLAKCLPDFGYSAGFACLKLDKFRAMRRTREAPLYDLRMRARFDPLAARRVAQIVRERDYRIIHAHTVRSLLVGRAASVLTGVPLIYHAHSPTSNDSTRRWQNRLNGAVERLCLRRATRVIAVSQAMAEHIAGEGFDAGRIVVVPNGVPRLESPPLRDVPAACWTLGIAALFRPRKGIEILLEAMALLREEQIPVMLRAVGTFESPKYEAEIKTLVQRLGLSEQVVWIGFAGDVTAELRNMDLLVLPSLFGEGLPMIVLEAMAAGVPVVASRVSGVTEAIRHGREGILVEPGDPAVLAGEIAALADGRYDWVKMRENAHIRQSLLFSDQAMAEGAARVYNDVLYERSEVVKKL